MALEKICPECGTENGENEDFCSDCGYSFQTAPDIEVLPELSDDPDTSQSRENLNKFDESEQITLFKEEQEEPDESEKRSNGTNNESEEHYSESSSKFDESEHTNFSHNYQEEEADGEEEADDSYEEEPDDREPLFGSDDRFRLAREQLQPYLDKGYEIYALFGYSSSGKTNFLYSLYRKLVQGSVGFGNYICDELDKWENMTTLVKQSHEMKAKAATRQANFFLYPIFDNQKGRHILFIDIAGAHFEEAKSWKTQMTDFIGTYLPYCSGYFILLDVAGQFLDMPTGGVRINKHLLNYDQVNIQLQITVNFMIAASLFEKEKNLKDPEEIRKRLDNAYGRIGKIGGVKIEKPVALCLSKADLVEKFYFEEFGCAGVPSQFSAACFIKEYWEGHFNNIKNMVPNLKVEWLSSLGRDFKDKHKVGEPIGLKSVFDFVILSPPPSWALPFKTYHKFSRK